MNPVEHFDSIIDSINELLFVCDQDFRVTLVNRKSSDFLGKAPGEITGRGISEFLPGDFKRTGEEDSAHRPERARLRIHEAPVRHRDGKTHILEIKVRPLSENGKISGYLLLAGDITGRREMEYALRRSEERFRISVDSMPDCFCIYRAVRKESGLIVDFLTEYVNAAAYKNHKTLGDQQIGRRFLEMAPSHHDLGLFEEYCRVVESGSPAVIEKVLYEGDPGRQRLSEAFDIRAVKLDDGVAVCWRDITDRKRAEQELRALTLTDDLTGLYNRRGFITLAQQQLKIAKRMQRSLLLLFADVDGLKKINDTLGHREGDRALIDTALIFKETFREPDIIARIGGDEFSVLIIEATEAGVGLLSSRFRENLKEFNEKKGHPYNLSVSMGIAHYNPENPCFINELLEQADRKMYDEKRIKRMG